MISTRRWTAIVTGVLFITATVTVLVATQLSKPLLAETDYLTRVSTNETRLTVGVLLELVAAFASVGIAVSLYPVLKKWHAGLALGSVIFRTIEAVMYVAGAVGLLSLVTLGRQFSRAGVSDRASLQAVGDSFVAMREDAILVGVFAFTLGALMYYGAFFQSRLIPRWLSGWGIAGVILMVAACVSALFSNRPVSSYTVLVLPIAVQEMVLAVWLIVRGFSSTTVERFRTFASSSILN